MSDKDESIDEVHVGENELSINFAVRKNVTIMKSISENNQDLCFEKIGKCKVKIDRNQIDVWITNIEQLDDTNFKNSVSTIEKNSLKGVLESLSKIFG